MVTIGIKCVDQVLSFTNTPLISTGDRNVDKVKFEFCELWNGFLKLAVFYQDKGTPFYSFIGADGIANVPNEIMKLTGSIYIAVTGVNGNDQIRTSNVVRYAIEEGVTESDITDIYSDDLSEEEQTTIYHQMLDIVINVQALVEDLVKNFAYVRLMDGNEFEYDEDMFNIKVTEILKMMSYTKSEINKLIENVSEDIDTKMTHELSDLNSQLSEKILDVESKCDQMGDTFQQSLTNMRDEIVSDFNARLTELQSQLLTAIDDKMASHLSMYHVN